MYPLAFFLEIIMNVMLSDAGRFEVKTGKSDGGHAFNRCMFTPKGVEWIAGEWAKHQIRHDLSGFESAPHQGEIT